MAFIIPYVESMDLTWDSYPIAMGGLFETNLAIITASIPAMKPIFTRYVPGMVSSISYYTSSAFSRGSNSSSDSSKWSESYIRRHPAKFLAMQQDKERRNKKNLMNSEVSSLPKSTSTWMSTEKSYTDTQLSTTFDRDEPTYGLTAPPAPSPQPPAPAVLSQPSKLSQSVGSQTALSSPPRPPPKDSGTPPPPSVRAPRIPHHHLPLSC